MKKQLTLVATAALILMGTATAGAQPGGGFPGGGPGGPMDPAQMAQMRADRMKETLKLNDDQYKKVLEVYKKESEEMEKNRPQGGDPGNMDFEAMEKQMEQMRANQKTEFKKILTDEQFKKWEAEESQRGPGGPGGPGGPRPQ